MFFIILLIVGKSIFHKKSLVFENPSTPFLSIITTITKLDLKLYKLLFLLFYIWSEFVFYDITTFMLLEL